MIDPTAFGLPPADPDPNGILRKPIPDRLVVLTFDEGATWENRQTIEDDVDGWCCYTAIHFVGHHVLLSHCAGNRPKRGGLEATQLTRFSLSRTHSMPTSPPFRYDHVPARAMAQRSYRSHRRPATPVELRIAK